MYPDDFEYKYMGIALKRRDNAPIVKTIFGGAMRELLDRNDVAGAAELVKRHCDDLVEGRTSLGQLTITKSLRAEYANAMGVAHKVLADRMAVRDPGNAPAAGDRIPYVYIMPPPGQMAAKLQGDRIETPGWVREHSLKPDYAFYITNQIQNPVSEMFAIVIQDLPGFTESQYRLLNGIENLEMRLVRAADMASEILFGTALSKCSKTAKRAFAEKFFGASAAVSADTSSPSASPSSDCIAARTRGQTLRLGKPSAANSSQKPVQQQHQSSIQSFFGSNKSSNAKVDSTMDSYLMDSLLVKKISDEKNAKKKEAAAAAAATSSSNNSSATSIIKRKIPKK